MKKWLSVILAVAMLMTVTSVFAEGMTVVKTGTLSLLNMPEMQVANYMQARKVAVQYMISKELGTRNIPVRSGADGLTYAVTYYDSLDAMLMALNAGEISMMEMYHCVAKYLCAQNDQLLLGIEFTENPDDPFQQMIFSGILSNDFSFLMMENNAELRDSFNAAIASMKEDGTLDKLVEEQITNLTSGGEIVAVELPTIEGAKTIKVAVTGALPPMDFVAPDGAPAGFNTAVLAEISRRMGVNIELVVVDSIGRATALASGTVDAVFWTRTNNASAAMENRPENPENRRFQLSEADAAILEKIDALIDFSEYAKADMPEGTITTDSYFSDYLVSVYTTAAVREMN